MRQRCLDRVCLRQPYLPDQHSIGISADASGVRTWVVWTWLQIRHRMQTRILYEGLGATCHYWLRQQALRHWRHQQIFQAVLAPLRGPRPARGPRGEVTWNLRSGRRWTLPGVSAARSQTLLREKSFCPGLCAPSSEWAVAPKELQSWEQFQRLFGQASNSPLSFSCSSEGH